MDITDQIIEQLDGDRLEELAEMYKQYDHIGLNIGDWLADYLKDVQDELSKYPEYGGVRSKILYHIADIINGSFSVLDKLERTCRYFPKEVRADYNLDGLEITALEACWTGDVKESLKLARKAADNNWGATQINHYKLGDQAWRLEAQRARSAWKRMQVPRDKQEAWELTLDMMEDFLDD